MTKGSEGPAGGVGLSRRIDSRRRWRPSVLTAVLALLAPACGLVSSEMNGGPASAGAGGALATAGAANAGTGAVILGGPLDIAGGLNLGTSNCPDDAWLSGQAVSAVGSQRRFYSWTTDEQAAELRAGGPLFSRSESPAQGRGLALTRLSEYAARGTSPAEQLAGTLARSVFAKIRFSWTNPWATLLGFPGESYGNQLLQIELRPEAWIAIFDAGGLSVVDAHNLPVALDMALQTPERIGALYFQSAADLNSGYCGSFSQGAVGFREFVLGNLQMVQRWSLATPEIADRLATDIAGLQALSGELACLGVPDQSSWANEVSCAWGSGSRGTFGNSREYDDALAIPSELYWPSVENVAALVAALQMSRPTGTPLDVVPGG